jgi:hypothetical protein
MLIFIKCSKFQISAKDTIIIVAEDEIMSSLISVLLAITENNLSTKINYLPNAV